MLSLANTQFGDDYLRERERSAVTQERAGLRPEWTIRLAVLYVTLLAPVVGREFSLDFDKLTRIITALAARMALDVEVAVESYIERHEQGLSYLADELARQSRILQRTLREQGVALQQTTARAPPKASIATLVAGLAHEIGTPMSVIQGHAKMLEGSVAARTRSGGSRRSRIRSRASSTRCSRSRMRAARAARRSISRRCSTRHLPSFPSGWRTAACA